MGDCLQKVNRPHNSEPNRTFTLLTEFLHNEPNIRETASLISCSAN